MKSVWELIDRLLAWMRNKLDDAAYQRFSEKLDNLQTVAFGVAFGALLVGSMMASIALDKWELLGMAIGTMIAMIPLGYLAYRFEKGCRTVGSADILPLSIGIYLDIPMVAGTVGTIISFIAGLVLLFVEFGLAGGAFLLGSAFSLLAAWLVANPNRIGMHVDATQGASRDILSLVMLQLRVLVRVAVPLSRIGLFCGAIGLITSGIMSFTAEDLGREELAAAAAVQANIGVILFSVVMPFFAYAVYVYASFLIGFAENILSIKAVARNTAPAGSNNAAPTAPFASADPAFTASPAPPAASPAPAAAPSPLASSAGSMPSAAPAASAQPAAFGPGSPCKVKWNDGSLRPGTARQVGSGQVLVGFEDGTESWVPDQYVVKG